MARVNFNKTEKASADKKTVHQLFILDSSGSMKEYGNDKFGAACELINSEIDKFKDNEDVNLTFSLIIFSWNHQIEIIYWKSKNPTKVSSISNFHRGMTALNDAICTGLIQLIQESNGTDNHLIKILTDGDENNSKRYTNRDVQNYIKQIEALNGTVTFVGTKIDTIKAQRAYGIDASNTMFHDNTALFIADELNTRYRAATSQYFKSVARGEKKTKGFFKTINNNETTN